MTKPLPHRPGKGGGRHNPPKDNPHRIDGDAAYIDVGTTKYPGMLAIVDAADLSVVLDGRGKWFARFANDTTFYATRCLLVDGKKIAVQMHRHILGIGRRRGHEQIVDHEDHDGLNNRRANLRLTDHSMNRANGRACVPGKLKGVFLRKKSGTFRAIIQARGQRIDLGAFATEQEAALAYDAAARANFGEFALTNFPMEATPNG